MKKITLLLTALMFMIPTLAEATSQRTINIEYKKSIMRFSGDQSVYVDPETGVEYIVFVERRPYGLGIGITPRFEMNGTLKISNLSGIKVVDGGYYGVEF
jgi:hypothetical protein